MNSVAFLVAAIGFVLISVFVFMNYPLSWRKDKLFVTLLALWHLVGTVALTIVFTRFRYIAYENIRHEICRTATLFFVSTTLLAMFFLFRIIYTRTYQFILRRTGHGPKNTHRRISDRRYQTVIFILLSFGIALAGYFNIDFLKLNTYDVEVHAESAESGLRICLVSDIHAGSGCYEYTYDDLVEQINACNADVLLIGGDLFDETTAENDADNFVWVLQTIRQPKYGIYYVYGNHDGLMEDWVPGAKDAVLKAGVKVLADEMVTLGEDIQLIGCLDPKLRAEDFETLYARLQPDPDKPLIVLTHRPKHFREMAALGVDLVMAGHTHGFNIPHFFSTSLVNDMLDGLKTYGDMTAITSSGVGAWGFHYKWPAESEVVCIQLHFNGTEE
ncbi:MAG: metallophosphoesterase [Clostridia bacterium]|nr:metallophosphoesterase [Clostridia bacterium]